MKTKEEIYSGLKLSGIGMVIANFIFLIGIIVLVANVVNSPILSPGAMVFFLLLSVFLFAVNTLFWFGFMLIEPNEARVLIFFGKYVGTVKQNGFFWVNPLFSKKKLTLRARNLDAEPIKVNDKAGNPIMIGMVVVWKVVDTYKASFEIDNKSMMSSVMGTGVRDSVNDKMRAYENFVQIQSDAALRYVAGLYPYDHLQSEESDELTLRSGGDEMNEILEKQINDRLAIAGIEVIEARVNYIAYAPEIAAVMLRRQQANAIIAAREKIVEGAVGMVQIALKKLSEENVIELDDDKKAAMVSNLMVVLCGEENAQPIVNTGTLYQ
ncbi:MAG: SPFH domain-containing protein [Lentimicrobiaceae bacterium]|nr:SPFH domain-containing protein [Lentimicrobiaceae bacterium]